MLECGQQRKILMLQPELGPVVGCSEGGILMSKRKRMAEVRALNHVEETEKAPRTMVTPCPSRLARKTWWASFPHTTIHLL
ncbi:hypothetical protein ACS0TY_007208 [Phlomoides rotata]